MNLPLFNHRLDNISEQLFEQETLVNFDIWGGLKRNERRGDGLKGKEYKYMTLMHSSNNTSSNRTWCSPPGFLSKNDHNVERILMSENPIIYNVPLRDSAHVRSLEISPYGLETKEQSTFTILVPICDNIEQRWKVILCFRIKNEQNQNPQLFLKCNQEPLIGIASKIYKLWLTFEGKDFNLYKVRGSFCENAIQIASLMVEGFSTKQMSEALHISGSGIEYHIESMRRILGATNRGSLIAELFRNGIVS
ncbi:LuxR C-terminal-related transcriptional regulator [Vibrio sp. DW001]|uniref:helix-turn-helix transcriptional regulator n=1 Tax=Vibrio sp. DW001 TaxID=2912315 RepID=UPI0023AEC335|nr:LuxR C-terminal-related transcriptional regulator [Vibrio sp. DW001]WED29144.1 LuxR C-terminal-related transcriptional regulator [Vibrio sp. DW001]